MEVLLVPDNKLRLRGDRAWYGWLQDRLNVEAVLDAEFPNPYDANTKRWESVWLGHLREQLSLMDNNRTVLVAHGTGADAALRLLENTGVHGAILIGPCDEYHAGERHGRPYHWTDIRRNCRTFVDHLYSDDDPFVTPEESHRVSRELHVEPLALKGRGRISQEEFPELLSALANRLAAAEVAPE